MEEQPPFELQFSRFTAEQEKRLASFFTLENFQLITPEESESYARITLPKPLEPAVRSFRVRLLKDSMQSLDCVTGLVRDVRNLDEGIRNYAGSHNLSEEEEKAIRQSQDIADFLDMLGRPGEQFADEKHEEALRNLMHSSLLSQLQDLLIQGLGYAMTLAFTDPYFERLRELREKGVDPAFIEIILREEIGKKELPYKEIQSLIYPAHMIESAGSDWNEHARFIVYDTAGEEFFKHPLDLVDIQGLLKE